MKKVATLISGEQRRTRNTFATLPSAKGRQFLVWGTSMDACGIV